MHRAESAREDARLLEEELAAINAFIDQHVEATTEAPTLAYDVMTLVAHRTHLEELIDARAGSRRLRAVRRSLARLAPALGWVMLVLALAGAVALLAAGPRERARGKATRGARGDVAGAEARAR